MNEAGSRRYTAIDRALMRAQRALHVAHGPAPAPARATPGEALPPAMLSAAEQRHAAGLMRVNHAGEICAQALYLGQAAVAKRTEVRAQLLQAAEEEADHLAWCDRRLAELDARGSALGWLWFGGSWAIGAAAGLAGDAISLGFIVETERQVEAHLGEHLTQLPDQDERSRAIVREMQADEVRHVADAQAAGARPLPAPIPALMQGTANIMKWLAYRF